MSLTNVQVVKQQRDYPLPKKGLRVGVLTGIIDVGVQQREYKGKAKAPARMVIYQYSLTKDTFKDDEGNEHHIKVSDGPFTLSPGADKGKYMDHCKALDPNHEVLAANCAGDITQLLGRGAYLTIVHSDPKEDGKVYANIGAVTQLPEEVDVPALPVDFLLFDTSAPTAAAAERLSKYQKDLIRKSVGYAGSNLEAIIEAADKGNNDTSTGATTNNVPDLNDDDSPI